VKYKIPQLIKYKIYAGNRIKNQRTLKRKQIASARYD